MTSDRIEFTDRYLKGLKSTATRYSKTDLSCPGLMIRVTPNGVKSWSIQYRPKGQAQRKATYGTYPEVSLKDARARAKALTAAAAVGRDLMAEEAAAAAAAIAKAAEDLARSRTVAATVEDYVAGYCRPNQRQWKQTEAMLRNHVVPKIGKKLLVELRRADVVELMDDLQHKKGLTDQCDRVLTSLKHLLNWSVEREWIEVNVAQPIKKRFRSDSRDRVLSGDELKAIWTAAEGLTDPSRSLIKVMILTGQRRDEVREMEWSEVDLERAVWTLPMLRNKGKREHVVPLAPEVKAILEELPRLGNRWVFTAKGTVAYNGMKRLKEILDREAKAAEWEPWEFHDIRRTVETGLASLGIGQELRDRVMNHATSGVGAKHYNKHSYLEEKKAALQTWTRYVLKTVGVDREHNVVVLRGA
ncbi:Putative prophage CPZ-55 integrase [Magnetospirillum gryphiswaldense MSR-1 v2]|uniref:Prophage CPZ-55 integrase n=1 Tax=Magnetospirillum gryphiswaldense (strain DSM 6361 / JCM 21280 / NBRC 15271 / MSR-1) TaxID=431944 RepID=V6F355_MAGGM|nr:site-specific integrase [Magnetospirillum gryphiswaldense]CDK99965.1 Putative prophage CPZ-55 integrase [Magnetospirillum gryphiswaldense MSR-1 v2]